MLWVYHIVLGWQLEIRYVCVPDVNGVMLLVEPGRRHTELVSVRTDGVGWWCSSHSWHVSVTITGGGVCGCMCSHSSQGSVMMTGGGGYPSSSHSGHGNADPNEKGEKMRRKRNVAAVTTDIIETNCLFRGQRKANEC